MLGKHLRVEISKVYMVRVLDEDDNELKLDYSLGTRKNAENLGRRLKKEIQEIYI